MAISYKANGVISYKANGVVSYKAKGVRGNGDNL
jgi:hypothetical protein